MKLLLHPLCKRCGLHFSATTCQGKILPSLLRRRDQAELLENAEAIRLVPDFDSFPSRKTADAHPSHRYLLACCGELHRRRREITGVGPTPAIAHHYLVSFGDQILNRHMEVGVGAADLGEPLCVVSDGANVGDIRIMVDPVGVIQLIGERQIPLVQGLLEVTTNECLIVFGRHSGNSFLGVAFLSKMYNCSPWELSLSDQTIR
jgi:hypothetical protein